MAPCPERAEKMQNERGKIRLITAAVLLPLFAIYIYFLPPFPYFLGLLLLVSMLTMREFYVMYNVPQRLNIPAVLFGGLIFYVSCFYPHRILEAIFVSISFLLLLRLITTGSPSGCMKEMGTIGIGFLYIALFLSFQWFLRDGIMGREYIFFLYASVWLADSGAYYVGTYLGRNRLYPAMSPNKTFEGAFGSIVGGAVGALIITTIFDFQGMTITKSVLIGAILGAITVAGDLVGSMFKRDAGVKDSSSLIPGHGGLLDKLDGLLLAGPTFYFILRVF